MVSINNFEIWVRNGFCKKIPMGKKSQTLCGTYLLCEFFSYSTHSSPNTILNAGTPEYLSPELVLQKGHTHCVDYWAFGCLVYELITNDTPFADPQQSRIFKKIVNSDRLMPHMVRHLRAKRSGVARFVFF